MDNEKMVEVIKALDALGIDVRSWTAAGPAYTATPSGTTQGGVVTLTIAPKTA